MGSLLNSNYNPNISKENKSKRKNINYYFIGLSFLTLFSFNTWAICSQITCWIMGSINGFWWIFKILFGPDVLDWIDVEKMSWSIVEIFVKFWIIVFILGFFDEIHFDLVHALHNDLILFHEDLNFFVQRILCLGFEMIAWKDSGSLFFVNDLRVWKESAVSVRFCGASWSFLFGLNAFMLTVFIFY